MRILVTLHVLVLTVCLQAQSSSRTGRDYAVFFHVTDFQPGWARLPETQIEALALKTELETNFDFTCELVANPTKQQIRQKIREYNSRLAPSDQILFFFSMHGHYASAGDRGYLIGKDGAPNDPYGDTWLSYDDLRTDLVPCKAKHVILALDACHSGAFGIRNKSGPEAPVYEEDDDCLTKIGKTMQYTGRQYCSSGNMNAKTPAKSLFATRFLEALRKGGEKGIIRFDDLEYWLGKIENPKPESGSFSGHIPGGDFVFIRKNACIQSIKAHTAIKGDRDGDGLPDERDACPDAWADRPDGCPDADEDGVPDKDDLCPFEKGPISQKGCPAVMASTDRDADGIPDVGDQCPDAKGLPKYQGCPDSDGDGVPDNKDHCPYEKGLPANNGCLGPRPANNSDNMPKVADPNSAAQSKHVDAAILESRRLKYWGMAKENAADYEKALVKASVKTPAASPFCEMNRQIGSTNIRVAYSSIGVKGRVMFGDLFPYGETWRTGANACTKVSFSKEVTIAGSLLPAGTYALYSIPDKKEWTFYFYSDTTHFGVPSPWVKDFVVKKVTVKPEKLSSPVENLLFAIDEVSSFGFKLCLLLSDVKVAIPFSISAVSEARIFPSGFYQEIGLNGVSVTGFYGESSVNKVPVYCFVSKDAAINSIEVKAGVYLFNMTNDQLFLIPADTIHWQAIPGDPALKIPLMSGSYGLKLLDDYIHPIYTSNAFSVIQMKIGHRIYELKINPKTDHYMMNNINIAMKVPKVSANTYYSAAYYYHSEKKDMRQALEWVNKTLEMGGDKFWILRLKAQIQAELGQYKDAIATANKSTEVARIEGNQEYQRMNEKSIQDWKSKL